MKCFYPSELNLCHMVPKLLHWSQTVAGRLWGRGVSGGQHIQTRPQWGSVIGVSRPYSWEAVPTNSFKREKCPWVNLCPLQFLSPMSWSVLIFKFSLGFCESLAAEVKPTTRPWCQFPEDRDHPYLGIWESTFYSVRLSTSWLSRTIKT